MKLQFFEESFEEVSKIVKAIEALGYVVKPKGLDFVSFVFKKCEAKPVKTVPKPQKPKPRRIKPKPKPVEDEEEEEEDEDEDEEEERPELSLDEKFDKAQELYDKTKHVEAELDAAIKESKSEYVEKERAKEGGMLSGQRMSILESLENGSASLAEICENSGVAQPSTSSQLTWLCNAKYVKRIEKGVYELAKKGERFLKDRSD